MRSVARPLSSVERKRRGAPFLCGRPVREQEDGASPPAEQSPRAAPTAMRAAFAIALAVLVSLASCRTPPKCNCQCSLNYDPVCAVDSKGVTQSYPNQCALECYKCTHGKDLRVRNRGECPESATRRPTPGSGPKPGPNGKCKCQCTFEYAPVCAGDTKGLQETYPSECSFECYKCTHGKDLRILKRGECSPNRPSPTRGNIRDKNQRGKCNCQCPLNYNPVCAADSRGKQETYPNSCSFECYKCTHGTELRLLKQGECSGKSTPRPSRPIPPGRNRSTNNKNCDCVCTAVYSPVCAVNSKGAERTFSSRCRMDCQNCQNNDDFVVRRSGECEGRSRQVLPPSKTRAA